MYQSVVNMLCTTRVMVVEASQLLGSFDKRLRQYAARKLIKAGVNLRRGMVKEAHAEHIVLQVLPLLLPLLLLLSKAPLCPHNCKGALLASLHVS